MSFIEAARRNQIIDCAIEAIAELGYAQASLAQIAKRAGISTGVISYYFAGKDDLIGAVARHVYATGDAFVRPRVEGSGSASIALRAFIGANVAYAASHRPYVAAMVEIVAANRASRTEPPFDRAVTTMRSGPLGEILRRGQDSGEFRRFSIPIVADAIIAAIDLAAFRPAVSPEDDAAELADLFDYATRARPAPPQEGA